MLLDTVDGGAGFRISAGDACAGCGMTGKRRFGLLLWIAKVGIDRIVLLSRGEHRSGIVMSELPSKAWKRSHVEYLAGMLGEAMRRDRPARTCCFANRSPFAQAQGKRPW